RAAGRGTFYLAKLRREIQTLFSSFFFLSENLPLKTQNLRPKLQCSALADPGAAENDFAVIENGGLARCDGALRRVERNARNPGFQRFDGRGSGLVLVADFGERANSAGRLIAGNPIHAFDFANCLAKNIVFANHDAVFLRIDGENVERLAGGETKALALADRKIVNAVVTADHVTVFVDDFALAVMQRNPALA